ncbi:MAG: tetratricopeptide repeat protein [Bryobacteraceae bacterium]
MRLRITVLTCLAAAALTAAPDLDQAQKLYNHTEFQAAIEVLSPSADQSAPALRLLGQSYFMLGEYKKSVEMLEKAVSFAPRDSDSYTWLGRAYGRRAETSFALSAAGFANKSRANLEKAVQLNPANTEAVSDLFEYYLQAPGFLGGGFEKASRLANQIAQRDPAEGNYAKARLAEEHKEFGTAEELLRRAEALAPRQVGRVLDLAKFLAKQGRYEEAERAFAQAQKVAPDSPKVMFARADAYVKSKRNIETARELLKRYLAANLTPDDAPKSEALKLLKQASGV